MILVTGSNGQLGHDVVRELSGRGAECRGVDVGDLDITDKSAVSGYISALRPEAVIHCAAYTAVDKAEDEPEKCALVNVTGTENIALACKAVGAKLMYFSTDYVFPGEGERAYETDDEKGALNVYGRTKYEGELKVLENVGRSFIIRTSWVFGINGGNFVKTMLRLSETRNELNVVCDQIGSPTYSADLAVLASDMIATEKYGVYHAANEGLCSWEELAEKIFELSGKNVKVNRVATSEYPVKAKRPLNSRLSRRSLDENGFRRLPDWEDALKRYLENELLGVDKE